MGRRNRIAEVEEFGSEEDLWIEEGPQDFRRHMETGVVMVLACMESLAENDPAVTCFAVEGFADAVVDLGTNVAALLADRVALSLVTAQLEVSTAVKPSAPGTDAIVEPCFDAFLSDRNPLWSSLSSALSFPFLCLHKAGFAPTALLQCPPIS